MAYLREDVAFEGYNQKQPLLVYQEKAYALFIILMDTINYRVVRSLLGTTARIQPAAVTIEPSATITDVPIDHPLMRNSAEKEGIKVIRVK